jgi:phenylacetic acid degradation operon negative regulatory protein
VPVGAVSARAWAPRRRGESVSSARALLLTVLGEFVLPDGGRAWTSTLIDALAALDVEAKAARQAIARTAAAGLLTSERSGRQVQWSLTPAATRLLNDGTRRIYQFGRGPKHWDRRWLLLLVSVPETNRRLRYRLRVGLEFQGFAALAPGVWASPWVEREPAAMAVLEDLGLAAESLSFAGAPGALGALEERVYTAWDLAGVAAEYALFIEATRARTPTTPSECFGDLASLIHDWRHFPASDPGLPDRLLPQPWPAHAAAELFHDRHRQWAHTAWQWWRSRAGPEGRGPGSHP